MPDALPVSALTPARVAMERRLVAALLAGEEFAQQRVEAAVRSLAKSTGKRFRLSDDQMDDLALDVLQRIFENNCEKLRNFGFRSRLDDWLGVIVVNRARDRHKAATRLRDNDRREAALMAALRDDAPFEREITRLAAEADVQQALAGIDPGTRQLITLRYLRGLSLQECAVVTGTSVSAVSSRIYRGLEELRQVLEARDAQYTIGQDGHGTSI
ncbi:MAG: RNA polymerase sigma factor [bacterium]